LWTNPGDVVFSPFTGVGSEGVVSLEMGRKFKGSELKKSYYNCAIDYLKEASGDIKRLWPCDPPIYDKTDQDKNKVAKTNVIEIDHNQQNLFDFNADKKTFTY
jgi:hypothetical protein